MKRSITAIVLAISLVAAFILPSYASASVFSAEPVMSAAAQQEVRKAEAMQAQLLTGQARSSSSAVTDWAGLVDAVENSSATLIMIANDIQMEAPLEIDRSMIFMSTNSEGVTLYSEEDYHHLSVYTDTADVFLNFDGVVLDGGCDSETLVESGGIAGEGEYGLYITNLVLQNCSVVNNLGLITLHDSEGTFYLSNAEIIDNQFIYIGIGASGEQCVLNNCIISGNISPEWGDLIAPAGQVDIYNTEIYDNSVDCIINACVIDLTMDYCSIYGNSGYINVLDSISTIRNTEFYQNEEDCTVGGHELTIENSNFYQNGAGISGAGENVQIIDCDFLDNEGGLQLFGDEVTVQGSNFYRTNDIGLYVNGAYNLEIIDCEFTNNNQGIKAYALGNMTISGGAITNNGVEDQPGGGIYCYPSYNYGLPTPTMPITIQDDCVISGNIGTYGAGICLEPDYWGNSFYELILDGAIVEFNGDENTLYGGGVYAVGDVTLLNSDVADNYASLDGGGIYCTGDVTLNRSNVSYNIADENGGGIYCEGYFSLNSTSNVRSNDAGLDGGGVYIVGTPYTIANQARVTRNSPDQIYFAA